MKNLLGMLFILLGTLFIFNACSIKENNQRKEEQKIGKPLSYDEKQIDKYNIDSYKWSNSVSDDEIVGDYLNCIGAHEICSIRGNYTNSGNYEKLLILDLDYDNRKGESCHVDSIQCLIIKNDGDYKMVSIIPVADIDSYVMSPEIQNSFQECNASQDLKNITNGWIGDFCGIGTEQVFFYSVIASNYVLSIYAYDGNKFVSTFVDENFTDDLIIREIDFKEKSFVYEKTLLNGLKILKKANWNSVNYNFTVSFEREYSVDYTAEEIIDSYVSDMGLRIVSKIDGNFMGSRNYECILFLESSEQSSDLEQYIDIIQCVEIGNCELNKILKVKDLPFREYAKVKPNLGDESNELLPIPLNMKRYQNGWFGDFCRLGTDQLAVVYYPISNDIRVSDVSKIMIFAYDYDSFKVIFEDVKDEYPLKIQSYDGEERSFKYLIDNGNNKIEKYAKWNSETRTFELESL